ncbi:hypothetical protein [Streptomyces buecherae]|uniref:hypothetical protein n=1 Tax=Streptomyces buecherae TaxID=2763006 RepID=UPI0036A0F1E7
MADPKLKLHQENAATGRYGDGGLYACTVDIRPTPTQTATVELSDVTHTFTAPTGWAWVKYVAFYGYNSTKYTIVSAGAVSVADLNISGKTLTFKRTILLNDPAKFDADYLCYNLALAPQDKATAQAIQDGAAQLGPDSGEGYIAAKIPLWGIIEGAPKE